MEVAVYLQLLPITFFPLLNKLRSGPVPFCLVVINFFKYDFVLLLWWWFLFFSSFHIGFSPLDGGFQNFISSSHSTIKYMAKLVASTSVKVIYFLINSKYNRKRLVDNTFDDIFHHQNIFLIRLVYMIILSHSSTMFTIYYSSVLLVLNFPECLYISVVWFSNNIF